MYDKAVEGIAYTYPPSLCIVYNKAALIPVARLIKIGMSNTGACFNYGYCC